MHQAWEPIQHGESDGQTATSIFAIAFGPASKPAPRTSLAPACSIVHHGRH
jgi:hypothetical protein